MADHDFRRWVWTAALAVPWYLVGGTPAQAQSTPELPSLRTPQPAVPPAPTVPAAPPALPPVEGVTSAAPPTREAALEDRIRQLETMVNSLSNQVQQLSSAPAASGPGANAASPDIGSKASNVTPSQAGGPAAPGQSLPPNPAPSKRFDSPATLESLPGTFKFGPGFELRSNDEEFFFQFHNLTQIDYRGYQQANQNPVHDTFGIPRQWFMFSGRITRPYGYFVSFAHGFDTISLLDVFIDINYDPRLQARIGRMKTPFTYEFLVDPIQGLINPERSVFFNNFGQNRDVGAMAFGRLFDKTFDYAAGVYNGTRNGSLALQDGKAFTGFINWKPFGNQEGSILENFNIGGSVFTVDANQPVTPQTLRTAVPTAGNAIVGVPFLYFNNNARETGWQTFWDLHAAWYYKQLALLSEWASGYQDYSLSSTPYIRTHLPVQSFYVQSGYLLTGETRSTIGVVKPLRPFDLRKGQRGPGAWELVTRYQFMDVGSQVFTNGLSDPNTSANRLWISDFGFNWHMSQYFKVYFEWEHAEFNQPVIYNTNKRQLTSDMFLVRLQLFF
jgi:phosphate-selective porin OprO/OprP